MPVGYRHIHSYCIVDEGRLKAGKLFLAKCRSLSQSDDILDNYASFTPDSGVVLQLELHSRDPPYQSLPLAPILSVSVHPKILFQPLCSLIPLQCAPINVQSYRNPAPHIFTRKQEQSTGENMPIREKGSCILQVIHTIISASEVGSRQHGGTARCVIFPQDFRQAAPVQLETRHLAIHGGSRRLRLAKSWRDGDFHSS